MTHTYMEKLEARRAKETAKLKRLKAEYSVKMEEKKVRTEIKKIKAEKRKMMYGGDIGKTIGSAFKGTGRMLKTTAKGAGKFMLAYGAELEKREHRRKRMPMSRGMGMDYESPYDAAMSPKLGPLGRKGMKKMSKKKSKMRMDMPYGGFRL